MAEINPLQPLDETHLVQINDALAKLEVARTAMQQAQRAGFDVTAQRVAADAAEKQLRQVKQVYFPNR